MSQRSRVRTATDDTRLRVIQRLCFATALCAAALIGYKAHADVPHGNAVPTFSLRTELANGDLNPMKDVRLSELSDEEYFSYSGVGALICTIEGHTQTSTAFLVGSFDLAVTVAHTFVSGTTLADPSECVYTSTDSTGQIRERIPVAYYKSQWTDASAYGVPAKDLAVVRLTEKSRFAHRTLPLGKFSGAAAPVVMIGFANDVDTDTFKRKSRGTVYERDAGKRNAHTPAIADVFTHDMDAVDLASGAPVLDERSGVIIGVHTTLLPSTLQATAEHTAVAPVPTSRNALITMNRWLETTLRAEIAQSTPEATQSEQ